MKNMELILTAARICGKPLTAFVTEDSVFSARNERFEQRFIRVKSDVFDSVGEKLLQPGVVHKNWFGSFRMCWGGLSKLCYALW